MTTVSASRCLSFDLEVGKNSRIAAIGAVRSDTDQCLHFTGRDIDTGLAQLDDMAEGASFLLGHNLIAHDLPHLAAANPNLELLKLPIIDTLRLSPLAFPRNPYHALIKHYHDGALVSGRRNDPKWDAKIALDLFNEEFAALAKAEPDLLVAWHWLCTPDHGGIDRALDAVFDEIRKSRRPSEAEAAAAISQRLDGASCTVEAGHLLDNFDELGWPLAYFLAWLSVAGGNSVMPPWVRHQFPEAGRLARRLRDAACTDPACNWCREHHDATKELKRWFGYDSFRPEPVADDGKSMQQAIVEEVMARKHALGILPTGTGKSLCYQIPALSRYDKTGALTVVISPLVALMADQVAGLERSGIGCCVTVNGLLSMPERADALDKIRLGDAGILLISPEQLRSRTLQRALEQREIGGWVIDEAHCLSRWGHDFRPDYRYVSRFIRKRAGEGRIPPVLCLTATAKPDVVRDITEHFRRELKIELTVFNGGAERDNLDFEVIPTEAGKKFSDILMVLSSHLPPESEGGSIVYCATRQQSEDIAEYLQSKAISADRFHAGLSPETKKDVQQRFIAGDLRVVVATNAFGMGIDKPDVRLVIHADIPGSLENYLQEAGRAGRDRYPARCVLLYSKDDVERQFGMSARSRLTRREIHGILRALRNLDRKKRVGGKTVGRFRGEVVATAGEILDEDDEKAFERDATTDDTRVRTAIAWLEESELVTREENMVQVFPSSLRVNSIEEVRQRLARADILATYRAQLEKIAAAMINADADEGLSTDELMGVSGLDPERVRGALYDLERFGIANNDTALTAFVHNGVKRSSRKRLSEASEVETSLISHMREEAPDLGKGDSSTLHLRIASQILRNKGLVDPLPERLFRMIRGIAYDGRGEGDTATGSLSARKRDSETVQITLNRSWNALEETARRRREGASRLLDHLLGRLPSGTTGVDLLAETTLGNLLNAIESDLVLKAQVREPRKLLDRALLWLHEQEVLRLNKGLAVFRPAMTIRLEENQSGRGFSGVDFEPLSLHYKGQVLQIHVMVEFANRGLGAMSEALRLSMDYFTLDEQEFLDRWLAGRDQEINRQTTPESWNAIVDSLNNPVQKRIVADTREQTNVLVLAGPGSGKTRVLVHRIAWLIRVRRENPRGIVALAYNRHAAVEIRRRLADLIGDDSRGVIVLTCHALAMRLTGTTFAGTSEKPDDKSFQEVMSHAVKLLRGEELSPEEADERRARLLEGFRWILVDEYQDVAQEQYDLISALAGRTSEDKDGKLTVFVVGDDDQNIYSFNGASVEFIRRFDEDYKSKPSYLTDNYRSTANVIAAANAVIEPAQNRMKAKHPITINRARKNDAPGGNWENLDPVARGRVQIIPVQRGIVSQAQTVVAEVQRLGDCDDGWNWSNCAVIAREWKYLEPVRAICEAQNIPVQMANEEIPSFWRMRETRAFLSWLRDLDPPTVDTNILREHSISWPSDHWHDLLRQAVDEHALEVGDAEIPVRHFIEWLAEWGQDIRRRQQGLLLLTAHRAKGLEFDHVAVLDGGWGRTGRNEDPDASRRLYYVAMTRARQTLMLARAGNSRGFHAELIGNPATISREAPQLPPCPKEAEWRYLRPPLNEINIGFAGRHSKHNRIHRDIANLSVGDHLDLVKRDKDGVLLLRSRGSVVGSLASSFKPPDRMRCRSAKVFAIVGWSREASDPKYQSSFRCDEWEVVVPELVYEPITWAKQRE